MNEKTTRNGRLITALTSFVAGFILVVIIPIICIPAMEMVLTGVETRYEIFQEPNILSAKGVFTLSYSLLTGLSVAAGGLLMLLAFPLYKGNNKWFRPIALAVAAIPCITGAYMFGPVMLFAKPYLYTSGIIILLGLLTYYIVLISEKSSAVDKLINSVIFIILGVEIAFSMVNGISSTRMTTGWGEAARTTEYFLYLFGVPAIWFGCLLALIGIPFYAARYKIGWWLVTGGSLLMFIATTLFLIGDVNSWFIGGIFLCGASLILLLIPAIGGRPISNKTVEKDVAAELY